MVIPIAVALARHDGDKVQYAIINAILQRLQSLITSSYRQYKQGGTQLSLRFDDIEGVGVVGKGKDYASEGSLQFDFRLRDLGIQPKHYPEAFDLLMKMSALPIQWEVNDPEHGRGMTTSPLFRPVYWNSHIVYDEGWEGTKDKAHYRWVYDRGPSVTIVMEDWVARKIMSPESGIGKMLDIATKFKSKFSIKLYWFFSLHWRHYKKFQFTWQALRLQLGIDTFVEQTTRNRLIYRWVGDTFYIYTQNDEDIVVRMAESKGDGKRKTTSFRWSEFKRDVLDTVVRDFNRLRGKKDDKVSDDDIRIEYTMSYDVVFKTVHRNNTAVQEPEYVTFTLEYSPLGKQIMAGSNPVSEQIQIEQRMENELFIAHADAYQLTHEGIAPKNLKLLSDKTEEIIAGIHTRNPKWKITKTLEKIDADTTLTETQKKLKKRKEIRMYALTCLHSFVTEELPSIIASMESVGQQKPSENVESAKSEGNMRRQRFSGWDAKLTGDVVNALRTELADEPNEYKYWVEPAMVDTYIEGKVLTVIYRGNYYKDKHARQHKGFLRLLEELRKVTEGRINDICATYIAGDKEYIL